jgi:TonB family protein
MGLVLLALMLLPGAAANASRQEPAPTKDAGLSSLIVAARDGKRDEVKRLLEQGANPNDRDDRGWSALIYACARGDDKLVSMLLEKDADINLVDNAGQTPVMIAVNYSNEKVVKLLLKKGADVDVKDKSGDTALGIAMRLQDNKLGELLLKAGAAPPAIGNGPSAPTASTAPDETETPKTSVDTKPIPLNNPRPGYTELARQNRVQGTVTARVLVGADGRVKNVRVVRGLPDGLTDQAISAAYNIKFKPAFKDGKPVAFWAPVIIEFRLR